MILIKIKDRGTKKGITLAGMVGLVVILVVVWAKANMETIFQRVSDKMELGPSLQRIVDRSKSQKMSDAKYLYLKGKTYYVYNRFPMALQQFQKVIDKYPQSEVAPQALYDIGQVHIRQKDFQQGIQCNQRLISDYPSSDMAVVAQACIGDIYRDYLKDYVQSIKQYQKVIDNYWPDRDDGMAVAAQVHIGDIYKDHLRDYNQALKEYRKVIDNWPDHTLAVRAQVWVGDCYAGLGDRELARETYQKVIEIYQKQMEMESHPVMIQSIQFNIESLETKLKKLEE